MSDEQAIQPSQEVIAVEDAPDLMEPAYKPSQWLMDYAAIARTVQNSITLPEALLNKPRSIMAVALTGKELGLGFMESIRLVHIIKGTPAIAAELKDRWIREAGGRVDVVFNDQNRMRLRGTRTDGGTLEVEWALSARSDLEGSPSWPSDDATIVENISQGRDRDGAVRYLISGDQWQNYPQDMLWARCIAQLHRRLFPDVRGASVRAIEEMTGETADVV